MGGEAVQRTLRMMSFGFSESSTMSIVRNLDNVADDEWLWKPSPGVRSIADIVEHVGAGKHLWVNRLFGDGSHVLGQSPCAHIGRDRASMMEWLRSGHAALVEGMSLLDDESLGSAGRNGFVPLELGWLSTEHDFYHAGELSHLRSIQQGNDRWGYFSGRS
jgi:hypothetical protein